MNAAKGANVAANLAPTFTTDTAAKTGHSERVIQRDAERGNKISDDVLAGIKGTSLDKGIVLDEIAKVAPERQAAVVRDIAERRAVKPAPAPLNDVETEEQWLTAIMRVWNRGAPQWRERFLETVDRPAFDNTRFACEQDHAPRGGGRGESPRPLSHRCRMDWPACPRSVA